MTGLSKVSARLASACLPFNGLAIDVPGSKETSADAARIRIMSDEVGDIATHAIDADLGHHASFM